MILPALSVPRVSPRSELRSKKRLVLALALAIAGLGRAETRFVALSGSDSNAGTETAPLRTIQKGVTLSKPGDTVVVQDGTYGPEGRFTCGTLCSQKGYAAPVTFSASGLSGAPITVRAARRWGAVLDCGLPDGYAGDGTDGVKACDTYFDFQNNASYIVIQDFEITRGYWSGANVNGGSNHDIQFIGNHFHHIGNRHYIVPSGTESYGIVGVYAGTGTSNILFDRNVFHHIGRLPTSGQSSNDYNHDHGLYVYNGPYTVTNNLFYAMTAGWDIQISPGTHDMSILHNTFAGPNPNRDGLIMLWADNSHPNSNITIQNNIFYNGRNYAIDTWQAYELNTLIDHNLVFGSPQGVIDTSVVSGIITLSNNRTNIDPQFVDTAGANYHLKAGSPAIDTGAPASVWQDLDATARPQGTGLDLGAYEFTSGTTTSPGGTTTPAPTFDFSVTSSPTTLTLGSRQSAPVSITTQLLSGTAGQVATFSVTGLGSGVRTSWSTTSCALPCSATLTLSTNQRPEVGTSTVTVTTTAGGLVRTTNIVLTVVR